MFSKPVFASFVVLAAAALPAGCTRSAPSGQTTAKVAATKATPDVDLRILDYDGILRLVDSHRGKVVVLDAWSTSCQPCIEEFPRLVELHKRYGPDQVACMSLSFDYEGIGKPEEQREKALKFLREKGATFDNVLSSDESDELYRKFHLASIPAVFVFDRQGKLSKRFDNEQAKTAAEKFSYDQVESLVAELLKAEGAATN